MKNPFPKTVKLLLFSILALVFWACADKPFSFVEDREDVFTEEQIASFDQLFSSHEAATDNEIALVTTSTLEGENSIKEFGTSYGHALGVGKKDLSNGLVIVYSEALRQVAISTGLGTEGVVTDSIAQFVIDTKMIPEFKKGNAYEGVYNGAKWIVEFLEKPENAIR